MATAYWYMTNETYAEYKALYREMVTAASENDQLRFKVAEEKFAALPGRPLNAHPTEDRVQPILVNKHSDLVNRIITVGKVPSDLRRPN